MMTTRTITPPELHAAHQRGEATDLMDAIQAWRHFNPRVFAMQSLATGTIKDH